MTGADEKSCTPPRSKRSLMMAIPLLVAFMHGCSEIPGALADIESLQDRTRALLEDRVEETRGCSCSPQKQPATKHSLLTTLPRDGATFRETRVPEDLEKQRLRDVLNEAATARNDAVRLNNSVKGYHDDAGTRHTDRLRQLRTAYEDDTWELIDRDLSPRSIVLRARQQAERELRRLEAGCTSPVVLRRDFGLGAEVEPGCEEGGEE